MERRALNFRKGLLKACLPAIRRLPWPTGAKLLASFGKLEYRLHRPLRQRFQEAVRQGEKILNCSWDVDRVCLELAGQQILWRSRDLLLDGCDSRQALAKFEVTGREHLDRALSEAKGCLVLTSHFGAHMLPAHWLLREEYDTRLYMERPRSISRFMSERFANEGPLSQDKLFISRKGDATESASSIVRAARVLRSGRVLFIAGDVRWSGQMTEVARFLGHPRRFSTTWTELALMTGAPVVVVFCRLGPDFRFHLEFREPFWVVRESGGLRLAASWAQRFLNLVEDQIRRYPGSSNDYLFWEPPLTEELKGPAEGAGSSAA